MMATAIINRATRTPTIRTTKRSLTMITMVVMQTTATTIKVGMDIMMNRKLYQCFSKWRGLTNLPAEVITTPMQTIPTNTTEDTTRVRSMAVNIKTNTTMTNTTIKGDMLVSTKAKVTHHKASVVGIRRKIRRLSAISQ